MSGNSTSTSIPRVDGLSTDPPVLGRHRSDSNGGSEPSSGRETINWDSLPVFFFLKVELVHVGTQTISVITKIIYIYKRTTTGVVSIKIYTHIPSPIYIYKNCTFTFTNQSAGHTVMNPY